MTVLNELTRLHATVGKSEQVHGIVESSLKQDQQVFTGVATKPVRLGEVVPERSLGDAIDSLGLLFLTQPDAVVREAATTKTVHARWVRPLRNRALDRMAACTFEVEPLALPAAKPALGSKLPRHTSSPSS